MDVLIKLKSGRKLLARDIDDFDNVIIYSKNGSTFKFEKLAVKSYTIKVSENVFTVIPKYGRYDFNA